MIHPLLANRRDVPSQQIDIRRSSRCLSAHVGECPSIPGAPVAFNSFVSWSDIVAANPDAVVWRIGANQGGGNAGLFGAVDAYSFNGTTFDFEAFNPTKDDCKDGGWETNWAAGTFKNQGACVSYFARMD